MVNKNNDRSPVQKREMKNRDPNLTNRCYGIYNTSDKVFYFQTIVLEIYVSISPPHS